MTPKEQATCIILFALLLRLGCGLHLYSGQHTPPKYGDYEAQRHWMEITTSIPVHLWYVNSTDNDLSYWGLDYPPLSGYQSWVCGKFIQCFDPAAVALTSSRGYETTTTKTLMRWTVIISDLLFLFPAALSAAAHFGQQPKGSLAIMSSLLLNPAQLLTDHGHFQYNGISLGLTAGAITSISAGYDVLGSFLFCLALNHKQMALYFAPVFFIFLLAKCMQCQKLHHKVMAISRLGLTVILTFFMLWLPYLRSIDAVVVVLKRIFPVKRGLFEDYVANFWCVTSLVVKWRRLFKASSLFKTSLLLTIVAIIPSSYQHAKTPRPTTWLATSYICAMAFYQFAYQVHEKTIIYPLLPLSLLANINPAMVLHVHLVATFSMGPLLVKDGLIFATLSISILFITILHCSWKQQIYAFNASLLFAIATYIFMACLGCVALLYHPPAGLPYIWDALAMVLSFPTFVVSFTCAHFLR